AGSRRATGVRAGVSGRRRAVPAPRLDMTSVRLSPGRGSEKPAHARERVPVVEGFDRPELAKGVVRRTLVLAVLMVPLVAVCWRASGGLSLGGLTFGTYVAVAGLLVACEHWLPFDPRWRSALQGSWTDFAYVILASLMDKVVLLLSVTIVASL